METNKQIFERIKTTMSLVKKYNIYKKKQRYGGTMKFKEWISYNMRVLRNREKFKENRKFIDECINAADGLGAIVNYTEDLFTPAPLHFKK